MHACMQAADLQTVWVRPVQAHPVQIFLHCRLLCICLPFLQKGSP